MSTAVIFETGCTISPGLAVCGPGGVVVQERGRCLGLCAKDDARLLVRWPNSAYYDPNVKCECGDHWCPSEDWLYPRPFERGWRQKATERFEAAWPAALPEGTKALYGNDAGSDDFAWLYAVRLPDGTEVSR